MKTDKILLIILDGWGIAPEWGGNAIVQADPKFYGKIWRTYPHTQLEASGVNVGLLPMLKGNSEAGHLNIGAGRIVYEGYTLVNQRLKEQPLAQNSAILSAIANAKKHDRPLHLMGLFSNGGIHSHIDHLFDLIDLANSQSVPHILFHLFTDGRDSEPKSAVEFLDKLKRKIFRAKSKARVATLIGRWWAMDRDSRWDRTQKAFDALVNGVGEYAKSSELAVSDGYRRGITDEFMAPTIVLGDQGKPRADDTDVQWTRVHSGDSVIFFNFRPDRARQITQAIVTGMLGTERPVPHPTDLTFVTFIPYQAGLPVIPAFQPDIVQEPLSWAVSRFGYKQLHIAETEKYAHVTYFLNGGHEQTAVNEERLLIPSPQVPTYNLTPAMSSGKITEAVIKKLERRQYHVIVVNYANPDMVGHTGIFEAALQSVLAVDKALMEIMPAAIQNNYTIIITADHGNVEQMINPSTGEPDTGHTRNPVPFIVIPNPPAPIRLRPKGILADVAPTILTLMGIPVPASMTGKSLIL